MLLQHPYLSVGFSMSIAQLYEVAKGYGIVGEKIILP
jgi:hypothetical protein